MTISYNRIYGKLRTGRDNGLPGELPGSITECKYLSLSFFIGIGLSLLISPAYAQQTGPQVEHPSGWLFLPPVSEENIYKIEETGTGAGKHLLMHMITNKDVGNLLIDVDAPLTDSTTLQWRWKVDDLPSTVAENTPTTHDYFGVAVLFDNGQDLSYVFSSVLPEETVYRCPLPRWTDRETHVVMHTGAAALGKWFNEVAHLQADYQRYVGGELPGKITQVWLIAGSSSLGGEGQASVGDLTLGDSSVNRKQVLLRPDTAGLDNAIAAVNATLPGHWSGYTSTENLHSGVTQKQDIELSYVTTSVDGRNYAYWSDRGLTLGTYLGDGHFRLDQWPFTGTPSAVYYQVVAASAPDAAGNWRVDENVAMRGKDQKLIQWHQVWSMQNGELSVVRDNPLTGSPANGQWLREYRVRKRE